MVRHSRLVGALLLLGLLAVPVGSTTLRKMSLRELTMKSEAIVVARVLGNDAAWHDQMRLIWTTTALRIEESWKGSLAGKHAVTEPGGTVHPHVLRVPGMARYRVGERVVIFLHRDVLGQWRTLGCCQGRLPFRADREGVERLLPSSLNAHVLRGVEKTPNALPRLRDLKQQVLGMLKKEGR